METIKPFSAAETMAGLAKFQLATVDHVVKRFYEDDQRARRFLVADETGLGKTLVARGVIAKAIEKLQHDPEAKRINVVYVCSNLDIAGQNLKKLDILGPGPRDDDGSPGQVGSSFDHLRPTRLTLIGADEERLAGRPIGKRGKPFNLVALTPGTMPGKYAGQGNVEERVFLHRLLSDHLELDQRDQKASMLLFQGGVHELATFERHLKAACQPFDRSIQSEFVKLAKTRGLLGKYKEFVAQTRGKRTRIPSAIDPRELRELIRGLRTALAKTSINLLAPDLIILDEFQRFRDLLSVDEAGETSELAALAQELFDYGNARVLLLSATPVKAYTTQAEAQQGDEHYQDLQQLLRFLAKDTAFDVEAISRDFLEMREHLRALGANEDVERDRAKAARATKDRLQQKLLKVMCRTERPVQLESTGQQEPYRWLQEACQPVNDVKAHDLTGWVALKDLAQLLEVQMRLEYWKSAPYFINFSATYQLGKALNELSPDDPRWPEVQKLLKRVQRLDLARIEKHEPIEFGSARLRALADETLWNERRDVSLHNLLWVPPSMPYQTLCGPFAKAKGATKHLVFSSWNAVPTAVAGLLSYEATRRLNSHSTRAARLEYSATKGRPNYMTTLMLFWPTPKLADAVDPRRLGGSENTPLNPKQMVDRAIKEVATHLAKIPRNSATGRASAYWRATMAGFDDIPVTGSNRVDEIVALLQPTRDESSRDETAIPTSEGLRQHVKTALGAVGGPLPEALPGDLNEVVAKVGLYAPGNIAWRALKGIEQPDDEITPAGRWLAAAHLAAGLRTLFNRPEATAAVFATHKKYQAYWRKVLGYCAFGDLQAVLDEHLFHLRQIRGSNRSLTDETLMELADEVRRALSFRATKYQVYDPLKKLKNKSKNKSLAALPGYFALRYGSPQGSDDGDQVATSDKGSKRLEEARRAFNSPFWPWVLTTTSVGQEGVDFHSWCHSIVHWDTPRNPVDFEQREGRVNRYGGLAIRKNLVQKYRQQAVASAESTPWQALFEAGKNDQIDWGELVPHWVYPGTEKIQRRVLPLPYSVDTERYTALKQSLAWYRTMFGQPRQEDLLEFLIQGDSKHTPELIRSLQINLAPPQSTLGGRE